MRTHPWPVLVPALAAALLAVVLFLAWTVLPDAHPYVVLLAFVGEAALLVTIYLVERRRHW